MKKKLLLILFFDDNNSIFLIKLAFQQMQILMKYKNGIKKLTKHNEYKSARPEYLI